MALNDESSLAQRERRARQLLQDALRASVPTNDDLSIVARRVGYELDNLAGDTLETRINDLTDKVVSRREINELIDALSDRSGNPKVAALVDMDRLNDAPEEVTHGARLRLEEATLRVVIGFSRCVGFRLYNDGPVGRDITFTATGIDNRWLTSTPTRVAMPARTEAPGTLCIALPVDQGLVDETREVTIEARADSRLLAQAPINLILLAMDKRVAIAAPVIDLAHPGPVDIGIENSTNEDFDVRITAATDVPDTELRLDGSTVHARAGIESASTMVAGQSKPIDSTPARPLSARSAKATLSITGAYRRPTVGSMRHLGNYTIEASIDHPGAGTPITGGNEVVLSPRVTINAIVWTVVVVGCFVGFMKLVGAF